MKLRPAALAAYTLVRYAKVRLSCFELVLLCVYAICAEPSSTYATLIEADLGGCYADCPFLPLPDYYVFCLRAGDRLYIGGHESWNFGLKKLASLQGRILPLRVDDAHLWVKLPSGWEVRLNQFDYEFSFKDQGCRTAAQTRSFEHGYTRPAPVPGEPAMPVMHGQSVLGWTVCSTYANDDHLSDCTVWDLKGAVRQRGTYRRIDDSSQAAQVQAWSDTSEGTYRVLHLRNGHVLKLLDFTRNAEPAKIP